MNYLIFLFIRQILICLSVTGQPKIIFKRCFTFGFCLILPSTGYKAHQFWLRVRLGREKGLNNELELWIFALRKEKRLRHWKAVANTLGKCQIKSQKVFDE